MLTLEQIKDEVANEAYMWHWAMLTYEQQAHLVDRVAIKWADQSVRAITGGNLIQAIQN